jgi:hypothetical protein
MSVIVVMQLILHKPTVEIAANNIRVDDWPPSGII